MRTITELPEEDLKALKKICRREKISRAEAVLANDSLLVTRNTRDFPATDPGVCIPYTVRRS